MKIGMRIYYDVITGDIIANTGERSGEWVVELSVEQDIEIYKALNERVRESFDYIELEYGDFHDDFMGCNGYRINLETKEIEFSYPDPNEPETLPTYRKPLSQELEELKLAQAETNTTLLELMEVVLLS